MNETAPPQKQDIDRLNLLLKAILEEVRELRKLVESVTVAR